MTEERDPRLFCSRRGQSMRRHTFTAHPRGAKWGQWCYKCGYEIESPLATKLRAGKPEVYGPLNREVADAAEDLIGDLKSLVLDIELAIEAFENEEDEDENDDRLADRYQRLAWLAGKVRGSISHGGNSGLHGTIFEELAQYSVLIRAAKTVTTRAQEAFAAAGVKDDPSAA